MLQDSQTIRHYQRLTDGFLELQNQGYSLDDLRLYLDGYMAALRHADTLEPHQAHRLEQEALRFLHDPSNFAGIPR